MKPDWQAISDAIGAATGNPFVAREVHPAHAGSTDGTWRLIDGQLTFFVKTASSDASARLASEEVGLAALARAECLRVPAVVVRGMAEGIAFLVLEALDLAPLDGASGSELGSALAKMHRCTGSTYGWASDNFIGNTLQLNSPHDSWPHFFADRRLRPQLRLAQANGMDKSLVARGNEVSDRVGALFLEYRPAPSLLHGDLWAGNAGRLPNGQPVIFDPACYWGDRETDLAMAELFGGFPTSFFSAYRQAWPLDRDFERRKPLYNLYHILNHFNLFGAAYLGQAARMIDSLLVMLKR